MITAAVITTASHQESEDDFGMILQQTILQNTRCARRAWLLPRNHFWFENLLHEAFIEDWWNLCSFLEYALTSLERNEIKNK